ncbi:hypothetical protein BCV72DRAFT_249007 [Rhizopus microsporus var. microsporus]|uniref:Aminopeptidase P N-terminal domain-containing protein n=1 Tax=Rhizopus microsporus var. microsporus TaxID=86635 RepID=A0A1X0R825_RHIZD|nr:hypothetical protein BCV72DRAFT_249007 [Rhizopus microsporus var. microsporus]
MEQAFETLSENRTRHEEVLGLLKRSLSKYNNPKEASLAARAIALTFINLDDISEGDSDNYYKRIVPSLKNAIMDSEEVDVKVDCLHTLALITYISASDADTKITRDYIFDLIETEGAEFNVETLSTNDKDSFIAEAIKAYGILYAASFSKEILLESSDKDIRMATGENIALIFETAHVFTATDEEEEEYDEDEVVKPEYENMNELVRTLKDLSVESNKRKTKSDRAEQKSMFRDILKSVEENVRPEEELKIGSRIIVFRGWSKILVLNAIRRTLGQGLQHHLKTNSLLKQIFNYSTGISSQQDDEDESEEEEEVLSNVDRRSRVIVPYKRHYSVANVTIPATHKRSFGQPTYITHPNLMKKGQVTPGFTADEFEQRRSNLMKTLPEDSVVISLGYGTRYMTNNIFYPFHQNTDFWYLCGYNEPDAALILEKNNSKKGYKQTMFVLPKNAHAELWDGPRTGIEGAKEIFGADEAYENTKFIAYLKKAIGTYKHVFMDSPGNMPTLISDESTKKLIETGLKIQSILPLSKIVQELRMIKSPSEIETMKQSGLISSKAFVEAMKWTKPGITEAQLWAKFDYEVRMRGSTMLAYVPVIAGGPNALSLHYVRNDMELKDNDLVLVDCGGEYNGYASDITRTWPVNGKFTEPQKELYQAVLNVNKACIKLCTEANSVSLHGIHSQSVKLMKEELQKIGFNVTGWDLERILYPHHVGHYLGLDVHDLHDLDRSRKLKQNMVITIEPGIYVPYDSKFPSKYHGIGIRIEDNVTKQNQCHIFRNEVRNFAC